MCETVTKVLILVGVQRRMRASIATRHHGAGVYAGVRVRTDVTGRPRVWGSGQSARPATYACGTRHCWGECLACACMCVRVCERACYLLMRNLIFLLIFSDRDLLFLRRCVFKRFYNFSKTVDMLILYKVVIFNTGAKLWAACVYLDACGGDSQWSRASRGSCASAACCE